jgi:hypothetical protein
MGEGEEKDNAEDAEGAEVRMRDGQNVDCGGREEKFRFAVQRKKARYHAGFVNAKWRMPNADCPLDGGGSGDEKYTPGKVVLCVGGGLNRGLRLAFS